MARCSPCFWQRLRPKNSCCSSSSATWKGCPSARRLSARQSCADQNQEPRPRDATKRLTWQRFPNTRSIDNGLLDLVRPNRFLVVDRFLDSRCQSRLSYAWWRSIFKEKGFIQTRELRATEFSITI